MARLDIPTKAAPVIANMDDPWADDVLHRKENAKFLSDFVLNATEPTTIFINGEWGSGKSFFLDRWRLALQNRNSVVVYFNAWCDDFIEDPIISLIGQLHADLHNKPGYKKTIKNIATATGKVLMAGLREVNAFVANEIGVDAIRFVENSGSRLAQRVCSYGELKADSKILHERLEELAKVVKQKTGYPLVFIVDELDRCMPMFAVRVLERIKHYFNIPDIVFVIGVDRVQLGHTIRAAYGDIDVDSYLCRFVDFDFHLSLPDRTDFIDMLWKRYGVDANVHATGRATELGRTMGVAKTVLGELSRLHGLTLRQIETVFRYFVMILRTRSKDEPFQSELAAILSILKVVNPNVLNKWVSSAIEASDIVDALLPTENAKNITTMFLVIAAVYATQVGDSAVVAKSANSFIKVCDKKAIKGSDIRLKIPLCVKKLKSRDLNQLAMKTKELKLGERGLSYSHKELLKIVARLEFQQYEAKVYTAMRNGIVSVDKKR